MKAKRQFIRGTLVALIVLLLCSCESDSERARREINEANRAYQEAHDKLEYLERQRDYVQRQIDAYGG